jgi:hypothetical protein
MTAATKFGLLFILSAAFVFGIMMIIMGTDSYLTSRNIVTQKSRVTLSEDQSRIVLVQASDDGKMVASQNVTDSPELFGKIGEEVLVSKDIGSEKVVIYVDNWRKKSRWIVAITVTLVSLCLFMMVLKVEPIKSDPRISESMFGD